MQYNKYFYASLGLHGLLIILLVFSLDPSVDATRGSRQLVANPDIVQAVVVDEQRVAEEVNRLEAEEKQQKKEVEEKQKQLAKKLEQVKLEREQEQTKLEQLKRDMAKAKQEEQNRLSEIKLEKEKEKKQLDNLKAEKEKEKKKLVALDDERQVEQDRVKALKSEREKEEKKHSDAKQQLEEKRKADEAKRLAGIKATKDAERAAAAKHEKVVSEAQRIASLWGQEVKRNKRVIETLPADLKCVLLITVLPDRSIQVKVEKSSGNAIYDDAMVKAAYKTQPFPLLEDSAVKQELKQFPIGFVNNEEGVR